MTVTVREIHEYRVRRHIGRLTEAASSTDLLHAPAAAADLLDALYALTRFWRDQGADQYDTACQASDAGRVVGGLTHLRGQAVHHAVVAGNFADHVAEHYYDHFGSWVWYADAAGGGDIAAMYQSHVANREIMTTSIP